jgi:hypothetical protein
VFSGTSRASAYVHTTQAGALVGGAERNRRGGVSNPQSGENLPRGYSRPWRSRAIGNGDHQGIGSTSCNNHPGWHVASTQANTYRVNLAVDRFCRAAVSTWKATLLTYVSTIGGCGSMPRRATQR